MNMNDHAALLPRRRLNRLSQDVTSRVVLKAYADGRVRVEGFAADQGRLEELRRLIGGADLTRALPAPAEAAAAANVTAVASASEVPAPGYPAPKTADPLEFAEACIQRQPMAWTGSRAMWTAYSQFAEERGLQPVNVFPFRAALQAFGLRSDRNRPNGGKGKQERGWRGGQLLTDAPQLRLVGE